MNKKATSRQSLRPGATPNPDVCNELADAELDGVTGAGMRVGGGGVSPVAVRGPLVSTQSTNQDKAPEQPFQPQPPSAPK